MRFVQTAAAAKQALADRANPTRAAASLRFFQCGPGQYGEGDQFIGVTVPQQREVARAFSALPLDACRALLKSPVHEHRLTTIFVLIRQYERGGPAHRRRIYRLLLGARRALDNWDLVDTAAPRILGAYLAEHPEERARYERFLSSSRLWDRRIAILTAGALIREGAPQMLLDFAARSLGDRHDLMHKAVGWMLREAGKRDQAVLRAFLERHAAEMPRTMLRYAIEKLPPPERKRYLSAVVRGHRPC